MAVRRAHRHWTQPIRVSAQRSSWRVYRQRVTEHSRQVETAADYLGVYLAARAGFAMDKANLLIRSLSALDPPSGAAPDAALGLPTR